MWTHLRIAYSRSEECLECSVRCLRPNGRIIDFQITAKQYWVGIRVLKHRFYTFPFTILVALVIQVPTVVSLSILSFLICIALLALELQTITLWNAFRKFSDKNAYLIIKSIYNQLITIPSIYLITFSDINTVLSPL